MRLATKGRTDLDNSCEGAAALLGVAVSTFFNKTLLILRGIGLLIALGGAALLWYGGKEISLDLYGGAIFSLPLEFVLMITGLILLALPLVWVYVLALVLPEKYEIRLLGFADNLDPEYRKLKENPNPQTVTTILHHHIHRANKRSYILIFVAIVFSVVVLPWLFNRAISSSQSKRESERLVSLVQESRIDFASGDHFRRRLLEAEGGLPTRLVATRNIFEVLRSIYDPAVRNPSDFDRAINAIYQSRIKPFVNEIGLLRIEAFSIQRSPSEARLAPATYLTLLATICNTVGDNGKHVDPYLQGRQLLRLAFEYTNESDKLAATHNMAGVNYAGLLKAYGALAEKFRDPQIAKTVQDGLNVDAIPSQLSLLRHAKASYLTSEQQSPTNLARARSLNNQVDLLMMFLYRIHVEKQLSPDIIRDETDRRFLEDELGLKMPERSVEPQKLGEILDRFRNDLDEALKLSQEPEIFFTRAQLFSIAGELGETYKLARWDASEAVANAAFNDLQTAAKMEMPPRHFKKAEAKQFCLEWLWTRPKLVPDLERLANR